jgi:transposase
MQPKLFIRKRDRGIAEAIKRWGYSEKEIVDYLRLHYFTVNRLIRREADSKTSKSKTPHYIEM